MNYLHLQQKFQKKRPRPHGPLGPEERWQLRARIRISNLESAALADCTSSGGKAKYSISNTVTTMTRIKNTKNQTKGHEKGEIAPQLVLVTSNTPKTTSASLSQSVADGRRQDYCIWRTLQCGKIGKTPMATIRQGSTQGASNQRKRSTRFYPATVP